jgi:hypothetical protein
VKEPGDLQELDTDGAAAWSVRVKACVEAATAPLEKTTLFAPEVDGAASDAFPVADWLGFPARIASCIKRQQTVELLDEQTNRHGGRSLQEEYLEWRVVRDPESPGKIRRIEFTTELPEYWQVLAAREPDRTLGLIAEFAGEEQVPAEVAYGLLDPFADDATPDSRARAFGGRMLSLDSANPYSDGRRAICCMLQPSNTLEALTRLATIATTPRAIRDARSSQIRCLTCSEAIPLFAGAAQSGRASDPVLVERLGRLAFEGRRVALDDPVGIYIQDVEHTRLLTPDGSAVPREWFEFSRGSLGDDGRARYQRLVFEVPAEETFTISELVDVATERPLRYGGEAADLIRLALFVRTSEAPATVSHELVTLADPDKDCDGCADVRRRNAALRAKPGVPAA